MLNFPSNPIIDQIYESGSRQWRWSGSSWTETVGSQSQKSFKTGDIVSSKNVTFDAPDWLLCDGAEYLDTQYPDLSALMKKQNLRSCYLPDIPDKNIKRVSLSSDGVYLAALFESSRGSFVATLKRTGDTFKPFGSVIMGVDGNGILTADLTSDGNFLIITGNIFFEMKAFSRVFKRIENSFDETMPLTGTGILSYTDLQFVVDNSVLVTIANDAATSKGRMFVYKSQSGLFALDSNINLLPSNNTFDPKILTNKNENLLCIYGGDDGSGNRFFNLYKYTNNNFTPLTISFPSGTEINTPFFSQDGQTLVFSAYDNIADLPTVLTYKKVGNSFVNLNNIDMPYGTSEIYNIAISATGQSLFVCYADATYSVHNTIYTRNNDIFGAPASLILPSSLPEAIDYVSAAEFFDDNYLVFFADLVQGPGACLIFKDIGAGFQPLTPNYDVDTIQGISFAKESKWMALCGSVATGSTKKGYSVLSIDASNFATPLIETETATYIKT